MELLHGESLDDRLARRGSLGVAEALRLLRQIASSLGAAHAAGVVHRDLKPENIFIVRDPEVAGGERTKLLDFGIAKLAAQNAGVRTQTSVVMGTPTFMSPEQCRGAGRVDQRSDIYSLGCVLFQLLVGRPPFQSDAVGDLIVMHMQRAAVAPSTLVSGIPPVVDDLVARCLAKDPAARYANGGELAGALDALLARAEVTAASVTSAPNVTATQPTTMSLACSEAVIDRSPRPRRAIVLAVLAVVLVVLVLAVSVARSSKASAPAVEPQGAPGSVVVDPSPSPTIPPPPELPPPTSSTVPSPAAAPPTSQQVPDAMSTSHASHPKAKPPPKSGSGAPPPAPTIPPCNPLQDYECHVQ
jgi:serine/threonine-protein kinase